MNDLFTTGHSPFAHSRPHASGLRGFRLSAKKTAQGKYPVILRIERIYERDHAQLS